MKKFTNLHMMALALAFTVLAGTSAFAVDRESDLSDAVNANKNSLSTQDFNALSEIPADPMSEAELDGVQGKYTPDPECLSGCYGPWPPFPWPECIYCTPISKFRLNQKYFENLKLDPLKNVFQNPVNGLIKR